MKLNEYLAKNAVKLMIKGSGEKNPTRQTNDLGMYDYVENLESVLGKMVWICDYRANADPTKKPIRISLSEQQFSWMVLKMSARPQRNLKPLPFDEP